MRAVVKAGVVALAAMLAVGPVSSAVADDADVQTQAVKEPVTVSVPVRTIDTPGRTGQSGILEMRMGRGAPFWVMLDTGSVGLRLWGGRPAAAMTSTRVTTLLDGARVPGLLGTSPMSIGGVTTTLDVPFQLISTDSAYIQQWKSRGVVGILGIGVGTGALTNPLVALPGTLGLRWSVHFDRSGIGRAAGKGALILGAEPATDADMHFQLPYIGENVNGARLWDDHAADGCWKFGATPLRCVPTWFDSGFTVMRIKGREFSRIPQTSTGIVRPGTKVSLVAGSSAYVGHSFVAGRQGSKNQTRIIPRGQSTINTGNSFYFDYTVTYDVATGDLYLNDPSKKGH